MTGWWCVVVIGADGGTNVFGPYASEGRAGVVQSEILDATDDHTHVATYPMERWAS